jgi:hypothetical protein
MGTMAFTPPNLVSAALKRNQNFRSNGRAGRSPAVAPALKVGYGGAMLTALLSLMLATTTPADAPSAWFFEDPARGQWCAFTSPAALESFARTLDLSKTKGGPGYGWVQIRGGKLATLMRETVTDEATLDDQYLFDAKGRLTEMVRSAHRVAGEEWVSFAYLPDGKGGMSLKTTKKVEADETLLADWPRHGRLQDVPFAGLIEISQGKATVREGCVRTPAGTNRAG